MFDDGVGMCDDACDMFVPKEMFMKTFTKLCENSSVAGREVVLLVVGGTMGTLVWMGGQVRRLEVFYPFMLLM